MRKRLSYANIVATLALVFAMTGGAVAANHYLVSSTKQIKPSVLKKLKGNTGAKGATGLQGAQGAQGGAGPAGPAGSAVAFAHVTADSEPKAMLDATTSKNISAVSEPTPGIYCISTTVPIKNAVGSADAGAEKESPTTVEFNFSVVPIFIATKMCPSTTTVLAITAGSKADAAADFWASFN
jgi:hypothetical protein